MNEVEKMAQILTPPMTGVDKPTPQNLKDNELSYKFALRQAQNIYDAGYRLTPKKFKVLTDEKLTEKIKALKLGIEALMRIQWMRHTPGAPKAWQRIDSSPLPESLDFEIIHIAIQAEADYCLEQLKEVKHGQ